MQIKELENKKVLILGFGKEGRDTYFGLRKLFPKKFLGIADQREFGTLELRIKNLVEKDKNLKLHLGENYLDKIGDYDVIIKTPGISRKELNYFLKGSSLTTSSPPHFTSQTEIFFDNFPGVIVGITGTKGKGTTSALIYNILKEAGLKVELGGNIGAPVFQNLLNFQKNLGGSDPPKTWEGLTLPVSRVGNKMPIFVYEMSSHQLAGLKKSPHIAVFLNLFPDHLDYYKNQNEYENAKANIFKWQTKNDYLIYNSSDVKVKAIAVKSKAKKIPFSMAKKNSLFKIIKPGDIKLVGDFNLLNIMAGIEVAKLFGVKSSIVAKAIKNFKGLLHRLEYAGKYQGIEFYNDSMSTIPEVAIAALKTFNGKVATLLAGGSDKGSDYKEMARQIVKNKVKNLIILGQGTGEKIIKQIGIDSSPSVQNDITIFQVNSMKKAIKIAFEKTPRGSVCLLSPGSASFNIFKDYQDRGNQFVKWIKFYGKKS